MSTQPSSEICSSTADWRMKMKAFLTTVMGLLSILVTGLGGIEKDVMWLWIGFIWLPGFGNLYSTLYQPRQD